MHNYRVYEPWHLNSTTLPERSYFYHIPPLGLGSAYVESLTSYISRLADAHNVSTGTLLSRELLPRIRAISSHHASAAAQLNPSSLSRSHVLNGVADRARDCVQVLERLTGCRVLHLLTMRAWESVISNQHLLRRTRAWCPCCFQQWRLSGLPVYDPLLWSIASASYCPLHLRQLEESCPHCKQRLPALSATARPGYCCRCRSWLGGPDAVSPVSSEAENGLFLTHGIGELISAASTLIGTPSRDGLNGNLRFCIDKLTNGSMNCFCRATGVSFDLLNSWISTNARIRFNPFTSLCAQLGISPLRLLHERLTDLDIENAREVIRRKTAYIRSQRGMAQINPVLEDALRSKTTVSLPEVAAQLGYRSAESLRRRNPSLCDQIARKHKLAARRKPRRPAKSIPSNNTIRDALMCALDQQPPVPLQTVAPKLGFRSSASLYVRFSDLCRAFAIKNKQIRNQQFGQMWNVITGALTESPPPTIMELASRLGCTAGTLKYRFPDSYAALIAPLPQRKRFLKEQMLGVIQRTLTEAPPPSMKTVAQRVTRGVRYLEQIHSDLCREIKKRHLAHLNAQAIRRRAAFQSEIRQAVAELYRRGIYPSQKRVFAAIANPSMKSTHILARQIALTLSELDPLQDQPCPADRS